MKTYKELCWLKAGQVWSWSGSDCGAVAVRGYKCCLMIRALAFLRFTFVIFWSGRFLGISCITENMTHHKWFLKPHKNINENKKWIKEARFWFCTWLNWSSGSGFGSRGLRLCTLEINNTTTSYSVFERRRYLRNHTTHSDLVEHTSVKLWWVMNGRGFCSLVFMALQETSIRPEPGSGLTSTLHSDLYLLQPAWALGCCRCCWWI